MRTSSRVSLLLFSIWFVSSPCYCLYVFRHLSSMTHSQLGKFKFLRWVYCITVIFSESKYRWNKNYWEIPVFLPICRPVRGSIAKMSWLETFMNWSNNRQLMSHNKQQPVTNYILTIWLWDWTVCCAPIVVFFSAFLTLPYIFAPTRKEQWLQKFDTYCYNIPWYW